MEELDLTGPFLTKEVNPIVEGIPSMLKQSYKADSVVLVTTEIWFCTTLKLMGRPCKGPIG